MANYTYYSSAVEGVTFQLDMVQTPDQASNTCEIKFTAYLVTDSSVTFSRDGRVTRSGYWVNGTATNSKMEMFSSNSDGSITMATIPAGTYAAGKHLLGDITTEILPYAYTGDFYAVNTMRSNYYEIEFTAYFYINEEINSLRILDENNEFLSKLERVYHPSQGTCSTAYLGDLATITLNSRSSYYAHVIEYTFGNLSGYVIETPTATTSVSWSLPFTFLGEFGSTENRKKGTLTITTYEEEDSEVIVGITVCEFTALLDTSISGPTFSPVIVDVNQTSIALTGNNSIIVRYLSNAQITTGAAGRNGATIASQTTKCGNQSFTGAVGTITAVESQYYTITATDSRGLNGYHNGTFPNFVNYTKISCNLIPAFVDTDGNLTFTIEGNCFKGSFGATSNTLTVQYRYKTKDGTYSAWKAITYTHTDSHNYSATISLSGLDYRETYIFQARATDKVGTIATAEITMVSNPIFDWGANDFKFNVPVSTTSDFTFAEGQKIFGTNSAGEEIEAFSPSDSAGNTTIGYGNYQNEEGATKIYGNTVDILSNGEVTINGYDIKLVGNAIRAITQSYSFTPTVTKGANYATTSCSLTLRGNCLYCRIYGSRSTTSGTGDIADELIGTFTFDSGGKISGMDYVGAVSSQTGATASIAIKNPTVNGNTVTFNAYLTNTATAGVNFMAAFVIPVSLNLAAF